jgi:phospholipase C
VSGIVAPEAYTEHPAWPAGYGAWYTAGVLDALTSVPEVWSKTVLLITFDENDGFFDHVVGAYPNVGGLAGESTVALDNELFLGKAGTPKGSNGVVGHTASESACHCSSSRRGARAAGSARRRSTTPR